MRIAIMGSGGLGGYFGARLVQGGADVHFVARGRHLAAMRSKGLRIDGPEPLHVTDLHATDQPAEIGVADVVMLCVKLWDTEQAIAQIRPMVGPDTAIISFQNGVLKDQALRAAFDARQLMGGVGYVATTIAEPGVIRQTGPMQRLLFGEFDGSRSQRGEDLLAACLAGMARMRRQLWGKAQQLMSQAVTSLHDPRLQRNAWRALALLAEERGDSEMAAHSWKRAAGSSPSAAPPPWRGILAWRSGITWSSGPHREKSGRFPATSSTFPRPCSRWRWTIPPPRGWAWARTPS